ncbi:MAG: hypothetical protein WCH83_05545 [Alphaproteobacteria bacterium]
MIRFALRLLGFLFVAAGFVALVVDGTRSIAGGRVIYTVVGETWRAIHFDSLEKLHPAMEKLFPVWLWDPVVLTVLLAPTSFLCLLLGGLLMAFGRGNEPKVGVIGRR